MSSVLFLLFCLVIGIVFFRKYLIPNERHKLVNFFKTNRRFQRSLGAGLTLFLLNALLFVLAVAFLFGLQTLIFYTQVHDSSTCHKIGPINTCRAVSCGFCKSIHMDRISKSMGR